MKKMMIAGGGAGFSLGMLCGLMTEGSTWPGILWRSSIAALAAGWLLRWFGRLLVRCVVEAHAERQAASAPAKAPAPLSHVNR